MLRLERHRSRHLEADGVGHQDVVVAQRLDLELVVACRKARRHQLDLALAHRREAEARDRNRGAPDRHHPRGVLEGRHEAEGVEELDAVEPHRNAR
jgi:hypothetical protein